MLSAGKANQKLANQANQKLVPFKPLRIFRIYIEYKH